MESCIYILGFIVIIFLILKIYFMKKSIKEISNLLSDIMKNDTNNLITISSNDKDIKKLAIKINEELKVLRKEKLQYESGNQELKKSLTNISHDLRTPLTAITGYVELLKKERKNEYIEIIERKTKELTNLTEELFDFSKTMDIGKNIKKEKVCINQMLEESIASYYEIFKEKNIEPNIKICNKKIYRELDKNSITRIFENILSNAIKYGSEDLKIELLENGKIIFSNKTKSLDKTTARKIFDRYFTVENAKKSAGIGLSIAKQLTELNGGTINANFENSILSIEIVF